MKREVIWLMMNFEKNGRFIELQKSIYICRLFANNMGSFSFNVGRSTLIFADNVVSKTGCLQFLVIMFAGRYN